MKRIAPRGFTLAEILTALVVVAVLTAIAIPMWRAHLVRVHRAEARDAFVADKRREYEEDVDLERLAADLVVDGVVEADELRAELLHRLRYAARRDRAFSDRRRGIPPV